MKILKERQIYWADKIAAGVSTEEIEAALGLFKKLRMRLDGNDLLTALDMVIRTKITRPYNTPHVEVNPVN